MSFLSIDVKEEYDSDGVNDGSADLKDEERPEVPIVEIKEENCVDVFIGEDEEGQPSHSASNREYISDESDAYDLPNTSAQPCQTLWMPNSLLIPIGLENFASQKTGEEKEREVGGEALLSECQGGALEGTTRRKKRARNPELWIRNKASRLRNVGEEYVDRKGLIHRAKMVQPCEHECRYECSKFSAEERHAIFNAYWRLGNWALQTTFLHACTKTSTPIRKTKVEMMRRAPRNCSVSYFLGMRRVCKDFLVKTLDITPRRLNGIIEKKNRSKMFFQ